VVSAPVKKVLIVVVCVLALAIVGLALWAKSVLTGDNVRLAIAAQISGALGQPVTIGGIGASIYPRVMVDLADVAIGQSARIQLRTLHLGTDLRALMSRRIEHADVRVDGARLELPLPALALGASGGAAGDAPVEIVSIDEIVLDDVEVISGGRTLRGDIEMVPQGDGVVLRRVALDADDTSVTATGTVASLAPVRAKIEAKAGHLNIDRLLAFLTDFAASSSRTPVEAGLQPHDPPATPPSSSVGSIELVLNADHAVTGGLTLTQLSTTAQVTPTGVTLAPMAFHLFGGRYEGRMTVTAGDEPRFTWNAKVAGMNMGELMRFAGSPDTITGSLAGAVALEGVGVDMERALKTARGTARIDVTDGTIAGLSLVRTAVTSLSGRGGMVTNTTAGVQGRGGGERFSRLGATLALGGGAMRTSDLAMTSPDVDLSGTATLNVANMSVDMKGRLRLSEALSKEAGTDLYRYTQEGGRVTLPATVSGPLANLSVRLDLGAAATRALRNKATEEIDRAIRRNLPGLGGLFPKKPRK
jgi:uncharacterized protein involved in outer membrane biogenesis